MVVYIGLDMVKNKSYPSVTGILFPMWFLKLMLEDVLFGNVMQVQFDKVRQNFINGQCAYAVATFYVINVVLYIRSTCKVLVPVIIY